MTFIDKMDKYKNHIAIIIVFLFIILIIIHSILPEFILNFIAWAIFAFYVIIFLFYTLVFGYAAYKLYKQIKQGKPLSAFEYYMVAIITIFFSAIAIIIKLLITK